jgi:hypothetical protein
MRDLLKLRCVRMAVEQAPMVHGRGDRRRCRDAGAATAETDRERAPQTLHVTFGLEPRLPQLAYLTENS